MAKIGLPKYCNAPRREREELTREQKAVLLNVYSNLYRSLSHQAEISFNDFQAESCDTGAVTILYYPEKINRDRVQSVLPVGEINIYLSKNCKQITAVVAEYNNTMCANPLIRLSDRDRMVLLSWAVTDKRVQLRSYAGDPISVAGLDFSSHPGYPDFVNEEVFQQ